MYPYYYFRIFLIIDISLLLSGQAFSQAAMLDDQEMQRVISRGLKHMYNMEFEEADSLFHIVKEKYPEHPAYDLLQAMSLTWEMMYFNSFRQKARENLNHLENTLRKTEKLLEKDRNDPEGIFFTLAGRASMALYYAQTGETLKAVNEARKAYALIKKADAWRSKLVDFNFPVGLYNYYVVQYPENHSVFKPFMFLFYKGDKEAGIRMLDKCNREGVYSKTESTYFLSHIYLRYEENYEKSIQYSAPLVKEFPRNLYFRINYCEALIGSRRYKEAEYYAYQLYKSDNVLAQVASYTFYGLLNERYFEEPEKARNYFLQALALAKKCENPVSDFTGQCYAGLGRYYHSTGQKDKAIQAYNQCLNETGYLSLMKEAKAYLDQYD